MLSVGSVGLWHRLELIPWSRSVFVTALLQSFGKSCSDSPHLLYLQQVPELQRELQAVRMALAEANLDKARLLQEVRKYNPLFQL